VAHTRLLIGRGQTAAGGPRRSPSIDLRAVTGDSRRPGSQKEQDIHRWPSPSPRQSWLTGGPRFSGSASHHSCRCSRTARRSGPTHPSPSGRLLNSHALAAQKKKNSHALAYCNSSSLLFYKMAVIFFMRIDDS